jgi:hypothetical protein
MPGRKLLSKLDADILTQSRQAGALFAQLAEKN